MNNLKKWGALSISLFTHSIAKADIVRAIICKHKTQEARTQGERGEQKQTFAPPTRSIEGHFCWDWFCGDKTKFCCSALIACLPSTLDIQTPMYTTFLRNIGLCNL